MNYSIEQFNGVSVIALQGDLIGSQEEQNLLREVNEEMEGGIRRAVVDLQQVRLINSTGLGLLTLLLAKYRNKGGDLAIMNISPQLRTLLIVTKLEAIFMQVDTPAEALEKLIIEG